MQPAINTQAAQVQKPGLSRVGKRPIALPKGVTAAAQQGVVRVEGQHGKLSRSLHPSVSLEIAQGAIAVKSSLPGRDGARIQGLTRALIASMVKGAAESYRRVLELRGTGYKAEMKGTTLHMALGFSHPIVFPIPAGIRCEVPADSKGTLVVLTGADKELMGRTAATIRGFRPPEPYGGKGVRYQGEKVREKAGKAGKAGKA